MVVVQLDCTSPEGLGWWDVGLAATFFTHTSKAQRVVGPCSERRGHGFMEGTDPVGIKVQ